MTLWRVVEGLAITGAVFVGGAAAGYGVMWILSRIARRWGTDPLTLPKLPPPEAITAPEAEAIRARAATRRGRAEESHAEGHAIESGEPRYTIKLVGRK
jgi:hypothetical protein